MSNPFNEIDRGQYLINNADEIATNAVKRARERQMTDSERAEELRANSRKYAKEILDEARRQKEVADMIRNNDERLFTPEMLSYIADAAENFQRTADFINGSGI